MYSGTELTHVSLFSGIGGIDLAAEWAGFTTVLMVENNDYCQKVLNKHWPDVPIIGDIKDVTKERIMAYTQSRKSGEQEAFNGRQDTSRGSEEKPMAGNAESNGGEEVRGVSERQDSNPRGVRGASQRPRGTTSQSAVTLITGGFPCQPVSQAGQRRGKDDDRWLWPEMLRVISEVRPTWVVAENVIGLLTMGFYDCLSDLESAGYETIPFVIPACGVNAPHRRDRIFIVAHYEGGRLGQELNQVADELLPEDRSSQESQSSGGDDADAFSLRCNLGSSDRERGHILSDKGITSKGEQTGEGWECGVGASSPDVADTTLRPIIQEGSIGKGNTQANGNREAGGFANDGQSDGKAWWATEPDVGRVAHGVPFRMDRLKALGNAVVPQQIYPILKAIVDIERGNISTT